MLDHVGIKVKKLDRSVHFYTAILGPLGYVLCSQDASSAGFGTEGSPVLWLYPAAGESGPAAHLAFKAANRKAVDKFHVEGIEAGGKDNGKAGLRADYDPKYYAAFLLDPDGNNVEAVCLK